MRLEGVATAVEVYRSNQEKLEKKQKQILEKQKQEQQIQELAQQISDLQHRFDEILGVGHDGVKRTRRRWLTLGLV